MRTAARSQHGGRLPAATRRIVAGVAVAAATLTGLAAVAAHEVSLVALLLVACSVAGGEALRLSFPARGGQTVRVAPSDAAVLAAIVLTSPVHVGLGSALGVAIWQAVDRHDPVKVLFNASHVAISGTVAAVVFRAFVPLGTVLSPALVAPYVLAVTVFMIVTTVLVSGVVASTSSDSMGATLVGMLPTAALVTGGAACLGLLAAGLADDEAYLLPALGVPALFVMAASRLQVEATVGQRRSRAIVAFERALSQVRDQRGVDEVLIDGIDRVVGAKAAVWRDGRWVTPVPGASRPCSVAPGHAAVVEAPVRQLGLDDDAPGVAVASADAVVVAWGGDLGLMKGSSDWVRRLVRSAAEHHERVAAEAALAQQRSMLQQIVDGTTDGIYLLEAEDTVGLVNPAMSALTGRVQAGDDAPAGGRGTLAADDVLGPGDWSTPGVRDHSLADGRVLRVSVAAVDPRADSPIRVGVVHDVTAERKLSRMKDDMLAVVSHELRTPLTPIKAAAQLLATRWERIDADQRTQLLGQLAERADHLTRLVEDLLLVARLSDARGATLTPQWAPVDVATAIAADVLDHRAARSDHDVVYEGPEHLDAVTDVGRVRQMVDNLVDNACKYSGAGTRVLVRLDADEQTLVIRVTDAGLGIAPGDLERIFERFERVEDPLVQRTSGAGLGLYIVRSLAEALGGSLSASSTVGVGTTMRLELPRRPEPDEDAAGSGPEARRAGASRTQATAQVSAG